MTPRCAWLDLAPSMARQLAMAASWRAAPPRRCSRRQAAGTALTLLCTLLAGAAQAQAGAPAATPVTSPAISSAAAPATASATALPTASAACAAATTSAAILACAEEDFLAATAEQAVPLNRLLAQLPAARRPAFRRAQKAWIGYRTSTCLFEASAAAGGSLAPVLQWRCAARLTRDRAALLTTLLACPEGDVACPIAIPAAPARP